MEKPSTWDWFPPFRKAYAERFGFEVLLADAAGEVLDGEVVETDCACRSASPKRRRQAAEQTLYWGEVVINLCCDSGYAMWAVPIMENAQTSAILIVQGVELESDDTGLAERVQRAADTLLDWVVRDNRINTAALELARQRAREEKERFYALERAQHFPSDDLRSHYLREEPDLLSAIKSGDTGEARAILNRILVTIYSLASQRMDLLKSCVLELVVMMSRAAVEAGANPSALLGANYRSLSELAGIEDDEDLARWVRQMLESLIEAIRTNNDFPHSLLLSRAMAYMREHVGENLRRDDVARYIGVSPGHFSRVMMDRMGRSFSDLLLQMRIDRAKDLLRRTNLSLSSIAVDCGFYDQSHLTKAFRKRMGRAPGEFRRQASR